ncbi:MAG: dTDP-glucose 4,6-dehydratase [Chromatiales bacterium]|nr:dTDP-glucose 4,6-dehydratase [Chromatiales bacterium]
MANLLVTGGAGFIGANFVLHHIRNRPQDRVVVLDALTYAGNRASLAPVEDAPGYRFVHGDVRDQALAENLLREEAIDTIVHFAAESHVDRSITGPDAFIDTNVVGTHALLKAARAVWLAGSGMPHRFHHISTDEVYGSLAPNDPAFTEQTPYAPNSPYSASKAASDHLVRAYHHTYGMQVTTSNCSNNYGPYQFPEKLIPLMLIHLLEGHELPIYGDGRNMRDWLYVEDHVRGIERILERGRAGETYNIGGRNEWTNIDLVRLLCSQVDARYAADPELARRFPDAPPARGETCDSLIRFVRDRPGHDLRYAIDCTKIERELGFLPDERFETGLVRTIDWYLDNETWWRPLFGARPVRHG